jgi:hypothetical protein
MKNYTVVLLNGDSISGTMTDEEARVYEDNFFGVCETMSIRIEKGWIQVNTSNVLYVKIETA